MKFYEVLDLHRTIVDFQGTPTNRPKLGIFAVLDPMGGYVLCVRTGVASSEFLDFLRSLATARKLEIKNFRGCLMFRSP